MNSLESSQKVSLTDLCANGIPTWSPIQRSRPEHLAGLAVIELVILLVCVQDGETNAVAFDVSSPVLGIAEMSGK